MKTDVAIAQSKPDLDRLGEQRDHARGDVKKQPPATRPVGAELRLVHTEYGNATTATTIRAMTLATPSVTMTPRPTPGERPGMSMNVA